MAAHTPLGPGAEGQCLLSSLARLCSSLACGRLGVEFRELVLRWTPDLLVGRFSGQGQVRVGKVKSWVVGAYITRKGGCT